MAIPNKKMYDRKGKLIFDPSNPEDVRRQEEINKQIEMAKELFSIVDPRGGGGIGAMARGISRAALAKMAKSKFAQNKAKQIADLVTKPMTRGKKAVTKKATPTVKEVVEKPVEIVKETLSRLLKPIPKLNKSKSFTTAKAKNALDKIPKDKPSVKTKPTKSDEVIPKINRKESYSPVKPNSIGSFKIGESAVGTSQTSKIIPEVIPTTIPKATEFVGRPTFGPYSSRANILSEVIPFQKDVYKNLRAKAAEKAKEVPEIPKEKLDIFSKLVLGTAGLGIAGGIGYQGYQGVKNRIDREKINPTELNNIKESDLRDSTKYKDVKILKTSTGDKGIIKDPKTDKWKYFNEKEGIKLPKGNVGLGDGPPIGLDNNNQNKGNNQGSNKSGTTTPRSKTGQAFDKAFAEARKQAGGAGGIFEWNGKKYGTALKGETVPKDRVEVGKTTTPVTIKNDYPTTKTDPTLEMAMEQDSIRQQMATKPLSSLVFKPTSKAVDVRNVMDEQDALRSIRADNKLPLKKKRYGGNLAMLKYMK
jgi:hypothetical protein